MDIEWDENKREINLSKHGVDFEDAMSIWENLTVTRPSRDNSGESRFVSFGEVSGRLLVVVYTDRDNIRRIISARKANQRERKAYHAALSGHAPGSSA